MGRFKVEFERLFFCVALACDIDLQALRDVAIALFPNASGKGTLHGFIVRQDAA